MTEAVLFTLALLCAATMGLAIQRGNTCLVAAVDELRSTRRATRLLALVEASLWVCGGVLLARQLGHAVALPAGVALTRWTCLGAALLGLGAVLNQACVFGSVARLGSGQWAWAATPLGFYLGGASVDRLFTPPAPLVLAGAAPTAALPGWAAWLLLAAAALRLLWLLRQRRGGWAGPWSPHAATLVIGINFVLLLLLAGAWAYTDLLIAWARGMVQGLPGRAALAAALLGGAVLGGWLGGTLQRVRVRAVQVLRCLGGGLLMGWGSVLVPGGNDGLILLGMPMLWPYAWAAFGVMLAVIGSTLPLLARR